VVKETSERVSSDICAKTNVTEWIHCYDNLSCVVFFVSLAEYAQICYEDDTTNRLEESLRLFDDIIHSKWFKDIPFILVLNKADMLPATLSEVPLSHVRPDFEGSRYRCTDVVHYIKDLYLKVYRGDEPNKIYPIMLSAIHKGLAEKAYDIIKKIVIGGGIENYKFEAWDPEDYISMARTKLVIHKHARFLDVVIITQSKPVILLQNIQDESVIFKGLGSFTSYRAKIMKERQAQAMICDQVGSEVDTVATVVQEPVAKISNEVLVETLELSAEEIQLQETIKKNRAELLRLAALLHQKESKKKGQLK
jgi:hypothetical protein